MQESERGGGQEAAEFSCGKDYSRAVRRAHRERLKRARRWHWGRDQARPGLEREWPKVVETPTACSCWMCGNPRKWFGHLSIPERRFWQGWRDGTDE